MCFINTKVRTPALFADEKNDFIEKGMLGLLVDLLMVGVTRKIAFI
jgi:hypothetical protein